MPAPSPRPSHATGLTPAQTTYLDAVRGLAAQFVLIGHAAEQVLADGWLARSEVEVVGVVVFFLLSGFLIATSVRRRLGDPDYGFGPFAIDRFARIFTAFVPALALVAVVDLATLALLRADDGRDAAAVAWLAELHGRVTWQNWIGNLLMLQDFPAFQAARLAGVPADSDWLVRSFGTGAPFWTVAIEWWLYMAYGLVVLVWLRHGFTPLQWVAAGFAAVVPFYYLVGGVNNSLTGFWLLGAAASAALLRWPRWCRRLGWDRASREHGLGCAAATAAAALAMGLRLASQAIDQGRLDVAELQFGLFLAAALFVPVFAWQARRRPVRPALRAAAARLADISFSLYLTHYTVLAVLVVAFPGARHDPAVFVLTLLLSNGVAIGFWWLFDRHHRRVGAWLHRRRLRHPPAAPRVDDRPRPAATAGAKGRA